MIDHVAIIMDGNRTWSNLNNLKIKAGYEKGAEVLQEIIENAINSKIKYLTVYAFSFENWNRSLKEIAQIMKVASNWLDQNANFFHAKKIRFKVIGEKSLIPYNFLKKINDLEEETAGYDNLLLSVAISYSGRNEIIRAISKISFASFSTNKQNLSEKSFRNFLDTKDLPDPNILIRTGGQKRLSNYMLWQLAYTEIFFIKTLWPDFNKTMFDEILKEYLEVNKNYGI